MGGTVLIGIPGPDPLIEGRYCPRKPSADKPSTASNVPRNGVATIAPRIFTAAMMRAMATAEKTLQYRPLAAPRAGNVSDIDMNRRVLIMVGGFRLLIALALLSAALLPVTPPIP